jgi:hypothetical protein
MADFDEEIYDEEVDEGSYDEEGDDGYIEEVEVDDSEGDAEEIGAEGKAYETIEWHADSLKCFNILINPSALINILFFSCFQLMTRKARLVQMEAKARCSTSPA